MFYFKILRNRSQQNSRALEINDIDAQKSFEEANLLFDKDVKKALQLLATAAKAGAIQPTIAAEMGQPEAKARLAKSL